MPRNINTEIHTDGFVIPLIKPHSLEKHRHFKYYAQEFATATKNKWKNRIFIDLFAGAGLAKVEPSGEIIETSTLLAMGLNHPFDKYIICDIDPSNIEAVRHRATSRYPDIDVVYIEGDTNDSINHILNEMPTFSREEPLLSLCLVDPFKAGNLKFTTIEELVGFYRMDIVILIPTGMDTQRNIDSFVLSSDETALDRFLGGRDWRNRWKDVEGHKAVPFSTFILNEFNTLMAGLGFFICSPDETKNVKLASNNRGLYLMAMYSKNEKLAKKLWRDAIRNLNKQQELF